MKMFFRNEDIDRAQNEYGTPSSAAESAVNA